MFTIENCRTNKWVCFQGLFKLLGFLLLFCTLNILLFRGGDGCAGLQSTGIKQRLEVFRVSAGLGVSEKIHGAILESWLETKASEKVLVASLCFY